MTWDEDIARHIRQTVKTFSSCAGKFDPQSNGGSCCERQSLLEPDQDSQIKEPAGAVTNT